MKYFLNYPEDMGKKFDQFQYPGGEEQVRFQESEINNILSAEEIVVIARISSSVHVLGLILLTDAIDGLFIGSINLPIQTLILPYLPYSRADRRFTDGDCHGLKSFGRLIDDLGYSRVVSLDVHSEKAKKYISNLITINPIEIIKTVFEQLPKDTVILLPDEGAKRYNLEKYFKNVIYCEKKRDPETGKILGIHVPSGNFADKDNILIVDDICDGGATFLGIAEQLPNRNLYLYVTHGIFSKGFTSLDNHFLQIFTTDSFDSVQKKYFAKRVTTIPSQGFINAHIFPKEEVWKTACQSS